MFRGFYTVSLRLATLRFVAVLIPVLGMYDASIARADWCDHVRPGHQILVVPSPDSPAPHRYIVIEPYQRSRRDLTHLFEPSALRVRDNPRYTFVDRRSVDRRILYDVTFRLFTGPAVRDHTVTLELLRERRFRAPSAPLQFRVIRLPDGNKIEMTGQIALLSCSGVTYTRIILDEQKHWEAPTSFSLQTDPHINLAQEIVFALASAVSQEY